MKFLEIKDQFGKYGLLDIKNVINVFGKFDRRRLYEWQQKGYINKITNNYYLFPDADLNDSVLRMIANRLYTPSYIGLESALSFYNLIPEAVFGMTSITTLKTKKLGTSIGHFNYRSIHEHLYWGVTLKTHHQVTYYISDFEKTLLDYFYLNPQLDTLAAMQECRFNPLQLSEQLNGIRLKQYLKLFSNQRLEYRIKLLAEAYHVEF